jgi:protocatechuate 3,4-dioxygenase, alpha subunit
MTESNRLPTTSSQTVGPYLHIGFTWLNTADLVPRGAAGLAPIGLAGRVTDGDGAAIFDAVVEVWQANPHGRYAHPEDDRGDVPLTPGFTGFGRIPTDAEGRYALTTLKPGRVPAPGGGLQAPHLNLTVLMRGMLRHVWTRVYFPDEPCNAEDAVLGLVPAARRSTLIATPGARAGEYVFDIVMQGKGETVFFDV